MSPLSVGTSVWVFLEGQYIKMKVQSNGGDWIRLTEESEHQCSCMLDGPLHEILSEFTIYLRNPKSRKWKSKPIYQRMKEIRYD